MTNSKLSDYEADLAERLLPAGGKIYVLERHTSRSGDTVYLQALAVEGEEIRDISWLIAKILDGKKWRYVPNRKALKISAVEHGGTDFAFDLADDLSAALGLGERLAHAWI